MIDWELIGWDKSGSEKGNIAFTLTPTQVEMMFKCLGLKINDDGENFQITQFTDDYLKIKLAEKENEK